MGVRVSEEELLAILDVATDGTGPYVLNFVEDAHLFVEETLISTGMTEARLKIIEKYLAAHLYTITKERGGITEEETGDSRAAYRKMTGTGLGSTPFGELALGADTSGKLAALSTSANAKPALFRVV